MKVDEWIQDGGKWYYVNSSGVMVVENWMQLGGKWYYFNAHGEMVTGWQYLGQKWYYFESNGAMINNTTRVIGGKTYSFLQSGAMYKMILPVVRREQQESRWCWTATAETIGKYHNPSSTLSQSQIVQAWYIFDFNVGSLCGGVKHGIEIVSRMSATTTDTLSFAQMESEINDDDPIAIYVDWEGAFTSHFMTIIGYDNLYKKVNVIDPAVGFSSRQYWHSRSAMDGWMQYQSGYGKYKKSVIS